MILPLDLRQERLDVVQIPPGFQSHFMGTRAIGLGLRRHLNRLQSGTQRFIHHPAKGYMKFAGNRFCFVYNIIVDIQCCSHNVIIASYNMMSRHHFDVRLVLLKISH